MGNVALTVRNVGRLEKQPGAKYDGNNPQILIGEIAMASSYATSGDTLDLSGYFSEIDEVIIGSAQGCSLDYVAGATAANGKVKAFGALTAHAHTITHTHNVTVTGGGAAANQVEVAVATDDNRLEKAKTAVRSGTFAGAASYTTGGVVLDLSATFSGIPQVIIQPTTRQDQIAIYDPDTGANNGKYVLTVASTGSEVANTTDVSSITYQWVGRGEITNTTDVTTVSGASSDANTGTSTETATASEVDNATNLSTVTATIIVVGKPA